MNKTEQYRDHYPSWLLCDMTFGRDDDDERFACDTVALSICLIRYTAAEKSVAWTIS